VTAEIVPGRGGVAALRRGAVVARAVLVGSPTAMAGAAILGVHVVLAALGPTLAPLVIAVIYAFANLAADLVYAYLDPRIRY
jgi:hypothetical protein